jgi:hypothetical protein
MDTITVIDTSISTDNLGDEIIMDAVNEVVDELFPRAYVYRVPSHDRLSDRAHKFIAASRVTLIGGTNLLSSKIDGHTLWRLRWRDTRYLRNAVCLGVGWNDYMAGPTRLTRMLLRQVLSDEHAHSVRDSYTARHLATTGRRSQMTSCVTLWSLTPERCRTIPQAKAPDAVFTLTAWRPDPAADRAFIETLRRHYRRLFFFPQMRDDLAYLESFGFDGIRLIQPAVKAYTRFLDDEEVDVVGTRLHGGIRALQRGRRALVLGIDNRGTEIAKDTNLPVVPRDDAAAIARWIEAPAPTDIRLPHAAISAWKEQFGGSARLAPAATTAPVTA